MLTTTAAFWSKSRSKKNSCDLGTVEAIRSPDSSREIYFCFIAGRPGYGVRLRDRDVVQWSPLGLRLNAPGSESSWQFKQAIRREVNEEWEQVWGERRLMENKFQELLLHFAFTSPEASGSELGLRIRAFNDGVAFRYEFKSAASPEFFAVSAEETEFRLDPQLRAWGIEAYHPSGYEQLYQDKPIQEQARFLHTPLTLEGEGYWLSIHEAALVKFSSMQLENLGTGILRAHLAPAAQGPPVRVTAPFHTPWRTIQIAERPGDLITSNLILNLNEPNRLADTAFIKPYKYMGIWWAMHLGIWTWEPGENLGATTEKAREYIDAAANLGIPYLLIEGWNQGWESWGKEVAPGKKPHAFNFLKANANFDLQQVVEAARAKGVNIIGHHETGGDIENYEKQMEAAFRLYQKLKINSVKTGYVAERVRGELHYGQAMVEHYQRVTELAAKYKITLNVHEPVKDTGLRRTYPNLMTSEGVRGGEYEAWGGPEGNPPSHTAILPFTRGLAGPIDYTPGIFNLLQGLRPGIDRVHTTLAKQLALYVVLYSPLQMLADVPGAYKEHRAMRFLQLVPVDWETSLVPHAVIGSYLTVVRRDRHSDDWYVGSITNEKERTLELALDFLPSGQKFCAEIFRDSTASHWQDNPLAWEYEQRKDLQAGEKITLRLAPGGGQALRIYPCTAKEF